MNCPVCDKPFGSEAAILAHARVKHAPGKDLARLIEVRGGQCHYCGCEVQALRESARAATRDHVVPRVLGGSDARANIVLACRRCNELRGHMDAEAFRRLMSGEAMTRSELWPHLFP